ncbi:uncharacterized protein LOC104443990 [Eucalyptus grandis]|uniref:uncharacterized protein LOC104443990 n=1 Tax=Eucalyptus grandis TaxID=71139 RepID=UPI00192E89C1|nr:uncharacterized protein LOC104443990 [Eucalyptus grandis]
METESRLLRLCIESACQSGDAVDRWRKQRRTLERLPSPLADALLRRLLQRRLLSPSLLVVFKRCVEEADLRGEISVDAEWMAYLGGFRYLRCLNVADCHRITSSALWAISGMDNLKEVDLSRCVKVTDAGIRHLLSISTLEKLRVSETGLTADGIALLASLSNLSVLDLGGLPVTDKALNSLQGLTKLQHLDLWGSHLTDDGVILLEKFPRLSFLSLAWTKVTTLPYLSSLECLNMSNCTIKSILGGTGDKAPLVKLQIVGATLLNEAEAFMHLEPSFLTFLDASHTRIPRFYFLSSMKSLECLDLSSSGIGDDSVELIAQIGGNLRNLNLNNTGVTSSGVGILAGYVPNLEIFSLSRTSVDDIAIAYIGVMPKLKAIDLSHTKVKGFIDYGDAEPDKVYSLTALQSLSLESLNLEQIHFQDDALCSLLEFPELRHLFLQSGYHTDLSLHHWSSLRCLKTLGFRDAVLTNRGLDSFKPPAALELLDLRGCWLLTEDAILLFHRKYPRIELRHELIHISASDRPPSNFPSKSSQFNRRTPPVNINSEKLCLSPTFVDQRLKYNREELLTLQYAPLSLQLNHRDDAIFKMLTD